ncbi:hypothetical protein GCM10010464_86340 [Pseudonocardia yunnanensis]|uniref:Uncharacterized protein n=1 Tax=Pseudonocardia yunnanensis TaxID=58107 RepID=A0ABW4F356_9PSEU
MQSRRGADPAAPGRIDRIALRMLEDPHDAKHVAQGVIIQLWTALAWFARTTGDLEEVAASR